MANILADKNRRGCMSITPCVDNEEIHPQTGELTSTLTERVHWRPSPNVGTVGVIASRGKALSARAQYPFPEGLS
ncbi:hypothetical protein KRMM14A1004_54310 [Krasilnikovia sp. MM14-A1004]